MKNTKLVVTSKKIEDYSGDLLVALIFQDQQGLPLCHELFSPFLQALAPCKEFSGKKDEQLLLYPPLNASITTFKCRRLLLLGLGSVEKFSDSDLRNEILRSGGGIVAAQCKKCKVADLALCFPDETLVAESDIARFFCEGIFLGDYQFLKYKKPKKEGESYAGIAKIELLASGHVKALRDVGEKAKISGDAVLSARDMANEPGNGWTPAHFAQSGRQLAKKFKIKCTVLEKQDMQKLGMGGMIAVSQGSEEPPKCIILEYLPKHRTETILLVGKGLTFDSGGVSLKPAQGMMEMKYDMCGGAAVLAAMAAVAEEKPDVGVVAIIPATDNMAGGGAFKPGDIISHYGGITTEIESTDAEGRLILADALAYGIEHFKPDFVIDLATLTGSVIFALGHHHAGLLSNNDGLAEELIAVGKACGEPLWRLPLGEMYSKQIESDVADIKNTGGKPGGCITAAEYLHKFVGDTPWAHLDIAGTAWNFTEKTYIPKGPSGFGVRILIEFLRQRSQGKAVAPQ